MFSAHPAQRVSDRSGPLPEVALDTVQQHDS